LDHRLRRPAKIVLLVDDVVENRKVLVDLLAPLGFTLVEADNGRDGLDKALELLPDLIVTDYLMPIMDGEELTHRLRDRPETCHIPIVMLSARVSSGDKLARLAAAADAFMTKPIDLEQLLSCCNSTGPSPRSLRWSARQLAWRG
jgi:CheY-like chemotaxis protein